MAPADEDLEPDLYGATLGLHWDSVMQVLDDSGVEALTLSTIVALRYAYGTGPSAILRVDERTSVVEQSLVPEVVEDDSSAVQTLHEFALYLGSSFHF